MQPFYFYLVVLFVILLRIEQSSGSQARCEKIVAPICRGLGYNSTSMPNFEGHMTQKEATEALSEFEVLLQHNCSSFLRLFVCSIYVPLCSEHVPGAVPACRGLCEEVKRDCLKDIEDAGFFWPAQLECSRFPEPPALCMQKPPESSQESHVSSSSTEIKPIEQINGFKVTCPLDSIASEQKCLKRCNADNRYAKNDQFLYEIWSAVWSILSMLLTKFALVTFFIQPKRFRWPARPILYLTVCGYITSLVYFIRWIFGPFTCAGDVLIEKSFDNPICICTALILTYCDFAFCIWWCVFCFVWYLSASKEWSTEALEKLAPRLHGMIWTFSFVPIIYALISSNIKSNFFTGFCEIDSYFVTNTQIFFLILGAVLAVVTSVALRNVRQALIYAGRSPYKLERLICRLGVICLGIFIPLLAGLLCFYFNSLSISLIKVALRYLSVIFASLWVFSSKTFKSWNKILKPAFTSKSLRSAPVTKV